MEHSTPAERRHLAPPSSGQGDRVYLSGRREALIVLAVFLVMMVWTVGYSYVFGYVHKPDSFLYKYLPEPRELTFVFGFPSWVFLGVIVPWLVCVGLSIVFGAYYVRDEDLGQDAPADEHGPPAGEDPATHRENGHA